jgi:hypothetical protein
VEEPEGGVRVEDVHGDAGVKVETLKKKKIQNGIFKKIWFMKKTPFQIGSADLEDKKTF